MSLLELLEMIGELDGQAPSVRFDDWRVGDQRYYVSDTAPSSPLTGWKPRTAFARVYRAASLVDRKQ